MWSFLLPRHSKKNQIANVIQLYNTHKKALVCHLRKTETLIRIILHTSKNLFPRFTEKAELKIPARFFLHKKLF
jgi:hypothetical protein